MQILKNHVMTTSWDLECLDHDLSVRRVENFHWKCTKYPALIPSLHFLPRFNTVVPIWGQNTWNYYFGIVKLRLLYTAIYTVVKG